MKTYHDLPASPFDAPWVRASWCDRIYVRPAPTVTRVWGAVLYGDCWLWTGWNNGKGHGVVSVDGERFYLHRYSYEQFHGVRISSGEPIDHLCRNRGCFNPLHHECVTHEENYRRGDGPSYQFKTAAEYDTPCPLSAEDLDAMIRGF